MKKLLTLILLSVLLVGCSKDDENTEDPNAPKITITVLKDGTPVQGAEVRVYESLYLYDTQYKGNGYIKHPTVKDSINYDKDWNITIYKTNKEGVVIYKYKQSPPYESSSFAFDYRNQHKLIMVNYIESDSITINF